MSLIERSFREKIVLVGVTLPPEAGSGQESGADGWAASTWAGSGWAGRGDEDETERHLDELELLVATAGADVVARVHQRRHRPDPATYIGKGKAEELRQVSEATDADTVVFDDELTPAQSRNLEKILGRTAIDRTAVILDIFAQNASTQEGKLQVELAQLRYRQPRLRGRGLALSQQAGRIGTRGPGETQLEVDRRRLVRRVHKLEAELTELEGRRRLQRQSRRRSRLYSVSLVGYTNAGKSTLLNLLTQAGAQADARLFATLDPRTKRFVLPGGEPVLISDTVGFVRKLPHQLVEAFRSTLEVVREADVLVHLVDSSSPAPEAQIEAVRSVLAEIGAGDIPELMVLNKSDVAPDRAALLAKRRPGSVVISARTGAGSGALLSAIAASLRSTNRVITLSVPFGRGDVMAALHREGEVIFARESASATEVTVKLPVAAVSQFEPFLNSPDAAGRDAVDGAGVYSGHATSFEKGARG